MQISVGKKFGVIIIVLAILVLISIVTNWYFGSQSKKMAEKSRTESVPLAIKAKDMQIAVIQVQQWLTDISATRAAEGFDDGFIVAKTFADLFAKHYNDFYKKFSDRDDKKAIASLEELMNNFNKYYK